MNKFTVNQEVFPIPGDVFIFKGELFILTTLDSPTAVSLTTGQVYSMSKDDLGQANKVYSQVTLVPRYVKYE